MKAEISDDVILKAFLFSKYTQLTLPPSPLAPYLRVSAGEVKRHIGDQQPVPGKSPRKKKYPSMVLCLRG